MRALSFREPWCSAVLRGKPIENRGWLPTRGGRLPFRFLVHAARPMSGPDYDEAAELMRARGFEPPPRSEVQLGGLVGVTTVVDWILYGTPLAAAEEIAQRHNVDVRWWMPDFGRGRQHGWILTATERRPFRPYPGRQLFFHVPDPIALAFLGDPGLGATPLFSSTTE